MRNLIKLCNIIQSIPYITNPLLVVFPYITNPLSAVFLMSLYGAPVIGTKSCTVLSLGQRHS